MLDTPCSEVVWRVIGTHSIRRFLLQFLSRASPCAITFQLVSTKFLLTVLTLNNRWLVFRSRARKTYMLISKASRTSIGAHSQSNCSMHDGKIFTGIKGAGKGSWQFTSIYCRVYNWVKLCWNFATRLQVGERLGRNLLGFDPSGFLGGVRHFGQLHSLQLQG